MNCSSKRSLGPTWQTAGTTSGRQFHDGFLYGVEDRKGTLTGWKQVVRCRKMIYHRLYIFLMNEIMLIRDDI